MHTCRYQNITCNNSKRKGDLAHPGYCTFVITEHLRVPYSQDISPGRWIVCLVDGCIPSWMIHAGPLSRFSAYQPSGTDGVSVVPRTAAQTKPAIR